MRSALPALLLVCCLPAALRADPMDMAFTIGPQIGSTFALSYRSGLVLPQFGVRTGLLGRRDDHLGDMAIQVGLGSPSFFLFEHCGERGFGLEIGADALFAFRLGDVYLGGIVGIGFKPVHVEGADDRWLYNLVSEFGLAVLIPVSEHVHVAAHFDFLWTPPLEAELLLSPIATALKLELLFDI
ncbi:MAG: hypothetical protein JXR96_28380 [Deltaproteobacteria bacterium]|nr:hypothetical protein [Deltaproteobacteria bacterium]